VEEVLDQPHLALAADERRLEARCASFAAPLGDHAHRAPERHRLGLALELVRPRVLVGDRGFGRAAGSLADEHRPGLRRGLDARGRVD
jgi:hypothetical protein